jgi:hypothetical protein
VFPPRCVAAKPVVEVHPALALWLWLQEANEAKSEYKKNKEYRDTLFVNINNNPDKAKELLKGYITVSKPIDSDIVISNIDTVNVILYISKDEKILSVKYNTSFISQDIKNINDNTKI